MDREEKEYTNLNGLIIDDKLLEEIGISFDKVLEVISPESDIKEYEENESILIKNSIKLNILSKLTTLGQLRDKFEDIFETWNEMLDNKITIDEKTKIMDEIDEALTDLGITVTSTVPAVRIAATLVSAPYQAQSIFLSYRNDQILVPRIKKQSPYYYYNNINSGAAHKLGGDMSGAAAGGNWR